MVDKFIKNAKVKCHICESIRTLKYHTAAHATSKCYTDSGYHYTYSYDIYDKKYISYFDNNPNNICIGNFNDLKSTIFIYDTEIIIINKVQNFLKRNLNDVIDIKKIIKLTNLI